MGPATLEGSIGGVDLAGPIYGLLGARRRLLNVWAQPLGREAGPVTSDNARGIWSHSRAAYSRWLIYLQDCEGDENERLFSKWLSSGRVQDRTWCYEVQAHVQGLPPAQTSHIAVGLNRDNPSYHGLCAVDLESDAAPELVTKNYPGCSSFVGTRDGGR
jgi:hypothetical protein